MANIDQREYLRNYKFRVNIGIDGPIGFQTVSGISDESEVIEYREGTMAAHPRKLTGQMSVGDVTFERGICTDEIARLVYEWRDATRRIMDGNAIMMSTIRRDIDVIVSGEENDANLIRYLLKDAWPSALETADLDSGASEVLIHTLTVVAEDVEYYRGTTKLDGVAAFGG